MHGPPNVKIITIVSAQTVWQLKKSFKERRLATPMKCAYTVRLVA